ncbi:response regulator transcription factor [archaeon]|jgi:DNA-binding response OmpR family regulator|nr:response regulator transcription factor [archaeon]MBT6182300.1 response regulator transcription factor [archaeon]MBT6606283.1 response regulator transcription factor [archaeon]MBT7251548.1 response regulator transcription factor [archaeon]MBT7661189.1 response regulator transcription factor [archaeon]
MAKLILVVDDEKDIRDSVRMILKKAGYRVSTAIDADDALEKTKKGPKPDLILLDIMMPGTPVKYIVPKLKSKIVFLSVVKLSEIERKALIHKGVEGFIEKPFNIRFLIKEVKKYIGKP